MVCPTSWAGEAIGGNHRTPNGKGSMSTGKLSELSHALFFLDLEVGGQENYVRRPQFLRPFAPGFASAEDGNQHTF
jgi:hypothetical protein